MRIFTFVAILIMLSLTAMAKHVDLETAKSVAATFWENNVQKGSGHKSGSEFHDITAQTEFSNIYILNTNGGFVIVSSDDAAKPILGYSRQGEFNTENIPVNAKDWLRSYCNEIQYAIDNNIEAGEETSEAWNKLRNGLGLTPKSTRTVSQLLTTNWNQAPYYNNLCPYDYEEDSRSVTGCAATAMAQLMKYWNWPTHGNGSHSYIPANHPEYGTLSADFGNTTYDWGNMPNALTAESSNAEINAVATLMYHCGVSMEMNYSPHGSGAYAISYYGELEYSAENALRDFFGYSPSLNGQCRSYRYLEGDDTLTYEVYPYDEWVSMLIDELDANRPIYYGGQGPDGGHGFIFDGYDNYEFFHVNWGWAGHADGYFSIDALEPAPGGIGGGSYQFNYDQTAIFGVEPAYTYLVTSSSVNAFAYGGDYHFLIYASNRTDDCTLTCDQPWLTLSSYTAPGSGETTRITATITPNTTGETRYATITVTQGSETKSIPVTQEAYRYTITVLSADENQGTVDGSGTYNEGSEIQISATPRYGYRFTSWDDGNTDNPRTITITENATYTANFEIISGYYTITVEVEGVDWDWGWYYGRVTYNGEYVTAPITVEEGSTPSFEINGGMTTNADYLLIGTITVDGEEVELPEIYPLISYTYTFEPVTANHTLVVTFVYVDSYDLLDNAGSISVYPNPNNGTFNIDFSSIEGDATYQIVNASGAVVETHDINVINGATTNFNHNLAAGTYFVRIINGDKVYVEQIVVE